MREAALHLIFDALEGLTATSSAFADNAASIAVSRRCGYEDNGIDVTVRSRGPLGPNGPERFRAEELRFRLTRERWLKRRRDDIVVHGFEDPEVRAAFGLD